MTIYKDTGISIQVSSSFLAGQVFITDLTDQITAYNHQIDADGGYKKASISFTCTQEESEAWLENGLMRHITVYDDAQRVLFEGVANQVSLTLGGLQISRGPVLEVSNRVLVDFTPTDSTVNPPVRGSETRTPFLDDLASQALYGILETRISGGSITEANALQLRSAHLAEYSKAQVSQSLTIGQGSAPTITIDVVGYVEYLSRFVFDAVSVGASTITTKILAVLVAEPNALISTDYRQVAINAIATPAADKNNSTGWDVLKKLVKLGDAAYNRCTLGIYAGRQAVYQSIPSTFAYRYWLADDTIELYEGSEQRPWEILPARWLFYADFLPGRRQVTSLCDDPRAEFIESVNYTAPFGLSLPGGKMDKLSQKVARMGIGGL